MKIRELLSIIPSEQLSFLSIETEVDYKAKKLNGEIVFNLLLYSMLNVKENSLRVMEKIFNSYLFQKNFSVTGSIKYNSLSDRLGTINPKYFEELYKYCVKKYQCHPERKKEDLLIFDSTLITLSSKIIDIGFQGGGGSLKDKKQIKFTIGYSSIPEYAVFHHESTYNSENTALKEAILKCDKSKQNIIVFDRGIQSRDIYDAFANKGIQFITRIDPESRLEVITDKKIKAKKSGDLVITKDCVIRLYNRRNQKTKNTFRCIFAINPKTGENFAFLTNMYSLSSDEILLLYKRRWEIEVFFKFIKQELNFSHLISRNVNGIQVVLYTTMILAILLSIYKVSNKLPGYKMVKLQFAQELETELIQALIVLYGGNIDRPPDKHLSGGAFW